MGGLGLPRERRPHVVRVSATGFTERMPMKTSPRCPATRATLALLAAIACGSTAHGQLQLTSGAAELQTVISARQSLDEFGDLRIESIPPNMLSGASGVAIFPNMIKGGFILGVNYGKGVLLIRRPDGTWSPPLMMTMGGGSLGFQAGLQAADIVLVFATPRSLQGMLAGQKVTLGADASVALGPVGRQANAATDARMGAEIYSYARSRGLFVGVSFNGASLAVDHAANAMLYGRFNVSPQEVYEARGLAFHPEVEQLIEDLATRARPPQVAAPVANATVPATALPGQPIVTPQPAPVPVPQPAPVPQPVPQPVAPSVPPPTPAPQPVVPAPTTPPTVEKPPLVPVL
jgi:lipid-binding SYLF domain-containing protein